MSSQNEIRTNQTNFLLVWEVKLYSKHNTPHIINVLTRDVSLSHERCTGDVLIAWEIGNVFKTSVGGSTLTRRTLARRCAVCGESLTIASTGSVEFKARDSILCSSLPVGPVACF